MMTQAAGLYPLLLQPSLHTKVWGGRALESVMQIPLPTDDPYGEAWVMHDSATVVNGPLAGRSVAAVLSTYGADLIGPHNDPSEGMPLLAKLLDANDWLSVQVHPNDDQARELEGIPRGKTEAWYVLAAQPDSKIVIGVHPGTSREEMSAAIEANTLEQRLIYAGVAPGDIFFIQAGTIHALGPGLMIYEIQQSCNTTYRLYDWGRMGLDGKPRDLHIEKGITVGETQALPPIRHTGHDTSAVVELARCAYFASLLHQIDNEAIPLDTQGRAFQSLTCIEGAATVSAGSESVVFGVGQTVLVPACVGAFTLSGPARVIRSFQP
ncbi:MAG: class I mannose-6-phosphate isomerase [Chloroflexi bacterium]|nr:class I mannose-6-phosphate isomerase [Chloroflexota bacterium]